MRSGNGSSAYGIEFIGNSSLNPLLKELISSLEKPIGEDITALKIKNFMNVWPLTYA